MKKLSQLFMASVIALVGLLAVPGAAEASAYGCAYSNPNTGPSPYCVSLVGSGRFVNYVRGDFRGSAFICDYYVTAEFFNANWGWYQTLRSPTRYGCATGGGESININGYRQNGYMCSSLRYRDGFGTWRSTSVCHRISG